MTADPIKRLRDVPLFGACTDKQLQFIASRVDELDFPAGKTLCVEGKSGGDFFIVLSGTAEVRRSGQVIGAMKEGDFFGEIALLDNGPRSATIVSTSPMRCLVLGPRQFQDVLHQNGEIAVMLLRAVTQRLRQTGPLPSD